jgi:hypothetical protein
MNIFWSELLTVAEIMLHAVLVFGVVITAGCIMFVFTGLLIRLTAKIAKRIDRYFDKGAS